MSECFDLDRAIVYLNNKGTGISYDGLHLLMLHSFVHREVVFITRETVLCSFNRIFMGCELVSIRAEYIAKRMHHYNIMYQEILIIILIIYIHFVCIQHILWDL